MSKRFLITTIRQIDGGHVYVYAATAKDARAAKADLLEDPAAIEALASWCRGITTEER